ncbi:MAG: single-stranded DNA-binding protein [Acholeplasmataceae bacterium]
MVNNVVLVGRITRDVDLRMTQSNIAVVSFSLAVNRKYTTESGERPADFINCVAWRHSAQFMKDYVSKGNLLAVTGQIQTRTYQDQSGETRYITEVQCDSVQLLERSNKNNQNDYQSDTQRQYEETARRLTESDDEPSVVKNDDKLPF